MNRGDSWVAPFWEGREPSQPDRNTASDWCTLQEETNRRGRNTMEEEKIPIETSDALLRDLVT